MWKLYLLGGPEHGKIVAVPDKVPPPEWKVPILDETTTQLIASNPEMSPQFQYAVYRLSSVIDPYKVAHMVFTGISEE